MADQQDGDEPRSPREPPVIPLWPWCVAEIKRKLHERRAERKKETGQDRFSRRTANATVAIAVLAVVAAVLGGLQWKVMQGQLAAMEADQRPWLSINTLNIAGPLNYDDKNPIKGFANEQFKRWHADISYSVSNVGRSPAGNVEQMTMLAPFIFGGKESPVDFIQKMRSTCDFAAFTEIIGFGREEIIFPGQSTDKVAGSLEGLPDAFVGADKNTNYTGKFVATVCVTYQTFSSEKTRRTARAYLLGKKTGKPFDLRGETVPLDQLDFAPSPIENSYTE